MTAVHIPILGKYGTVSLTGKMSNSAWILSLFLAKFAFNAWRKRDDQCIVLKRSPLIEWKKSSNSVAAAMLFVDTEYRAEHDTVAAVNGVVIHRGEEHSGVLSAEPMQLEEMRTVPFAVENSCDDEYEIDSPFFMRGGSTISSAGDDENGNDSPYEDRTNI